MCFSHKETAPKMIRPKQWTMSITCIIVYAFATKSKHNISFRHSPIRQIRNLLDCEYAKGTAKTMHSRTKAREWAVQRLTGGKASELHTTWDKRERNAVRKASGGRSGKNINVVCFIYWRLRGVINFLHSYVRLQQRIQVIHWTIYLVFGCVLHLQHTRRLVMVTHWVPSASLCWFCLCSLCCRHNKERANRRKGVQKKNRTIF